MINNDVLNENNNQDQNVIKISRLRKAISKKMIISKTIIPETTLMDEIDITNLVNLRKNLKNKAQEKGIKLTYMAFIAKVVTLLLKEFPLFNSTFKDETNELVHKKNINLGIAVDTEQGLIVPNIKNAENLSIFELAEEIQKVAQAAIEKRLKLEQIQNGTFTLSNFGSVGILYATPIINHPELAILGIGKIIQKPVFKNEEICLAHILPLSLSIDHRIIDGADGGRFLKRFTEILNNIDLLDKNI